jgi:hypothetical protein
MYMADYLSQATTEGMKQFFMKHSSKKKGAME